MKTFRFPFSFGLALLLALGARAATVTGSLKGANNVALTNAVVRFSPVDAPLAAPPDLIAAGDILVTTDSTGAFSTVLAAGNYKVTAPNTRALTIAAPTGDGTFSILDLVTGGLKIGGNYVPGGPSTVPLATTNISGKVFAASLSTNPIVPLVSDLTAATNTLATALLAATATQLTAATNAVALAALANNNTASNALASATTTASNALASATTTASNALASATTTVGTVASNAVVQPYKFTASGLTLNVAGGVPAGAVAGAVNYGGGGTVSLIANYTNHIYLIGTNLVPMSRAIHRGGIYLGYAVTGSNAVTTLWQPATIGYKPSRLARFLQKQRQGQLLLFRGIGDSYTQGAGATGYSNWFNLVTSTTFSSAGYNIVGATNITAQNYGIGGAASIVGLAFTGTQVAMQWGSAIGDFRGAAMHRTEYANARQQNYGAVKLVGPTLLQQTVPDLVTLSFGNLSSYDYDLSVAQHETAVRRYLAAGSDVLLWTEAPFYSSYPATNITGWPLNQDSARVETIADAAGCELCDTYGAFQWIHDAGLTTNYYFSDYVHPNNAGHALIALLIQNQLSPGYIPAVENYASRRRTQYPVGAYATAYGGGCDLQFEYAGNGTTIADANAYTYSAPNLNTLATGVATNANCYSLGVGQHATFEHGGATGVGIITSVPNGVTVVGYIAENSTNQVSGSSLITITGSYNNQYTKIFQLGDFYACGITSWPAGYNSPNRLPVYQTRFNFYIKSITGGTNCPVVGWVYETPERKAITPTFTGTWSTETGNYLLHEQYMPVNYTDSANAAITFNYDTDLAEVWILAGPNIGKVTAIVDGSLVLQNAKPYSAGVAGYLFPLYLQNGNSPAVNTSQNPYHLATRTTHSVGIYVNSAGASPSIGDRSLEILGVNGLNFE